MTNAIQSGKVLVFPPPMKLILALLIFGWLAAVTFCGPELYRAINGPDAVKAKTHRVR